MFDWFKLVYAARWAVRRIRSLYPARLGDFPSSRFAVDNRQQPLKPCPCSDCTKKLENAKAHLLEVLEIAQKVNSVNLLLEFLVAAARTEPDKTLARAWVRVAVMHPNSTSELRNFAAPDIEKLEVVLKPVEAEALYKVLPQVKQRLMQAQ